MDLAGVKVQLVTWNQVKADGAQWVYVELWNTGPIAAVWASEGLALSRGARRVMTPAELKEGL